MNYITQPIQFDPIAIQKGFDTAPWQEQGMPLGQWLQGIRNGTIQPPMGIDAQHPGRSLMMQALQQQLQSRMSQGAGGAGQPTQRFDPGLFKSALQNIFGGANAAA